MHTLQDGTETEDANIGNIMGENLSVFLFCPKSIDGKVTNWVGV